MRRILLFALICLCCGCGTRFVGVPETASTLQHWTLARDYQAQGRFELAKQYYTLALADARTPQAQEALKIEIEGAERQIQAMR